MIAILLNAILLNAILLNAILINAILKNAILMNAILMNEILMNEILMHVILMNEILMNSNLLNVILQNAILLCKSAARNSDECHSFVNQFTKYRGFECHSTECHGTSRIPLLANICLRIPRRDIQHYKCAQRH
jgi:hypothetical protein